jgi:signal peptidase II
MSAARRYVPVFAAAGVVVLLDRLSKNWAVAELHDKGRVVDVALGVQFRFAQNQGMAFSKFANSGTVIGLIAVAIVVGLVWFARTVPSLWARIIIGVVIGGALGNLIDRMTRLPAPGNPSGFLKGAVVDFIYTSWWPTFNVADAAVVVGGIALAIVAWRMPEEPVPEEPVPVDPESTAT